MTGDRARLRRVVESRPTPEGRILVNVAWPQIEALLAAALDLPADARESFLDAACVADPALRAELAALVAASEQPGRVDTPVAALSGLLEDLDEPIQRLDSGSRLGPYVIERQLGAGGMGQVYRARDTRLDRNVAIKIVAPHLQHDPTSRKRLEREARVIASVSHPNIVAIFDIGDHDGMMYVVTELLSGRTLRAMLESGRLSEQKVVDIATQVAHGLSAAHARQVVHRDLKPENLFVTEQGAVKILDFGLAKPHDVDADRKRTSITCSHAVLGTIGYMSPEQITGDAVDARSDIFSLGAVLYEAVTGVHAFGGSTRSEIAAAILSSPPTLSNLGSLSPALAQTITRCLAKSPADRYQTALDLGFTLQLIASSSAHPPISPAAQAIARGSPRRWWGLAAVTAAMVIALTAVSGPIARMVRTDFEERPITFVVHAPKGASFERVTMAPHPTLSPDGRRLAFLATSAAQRTLFVQTLGELESRPLAASGESALPFWSADGNFIAFGSLERLQKVAASGDRAPQEICACDARAGGAWSRDGTIVFAGAQGLFRVSSDGGNVTPLTQLDESRGEFSHRFPLLLPDGRQFLYLIMSTREENRGVYLGSFDNPTLKRRVLADDSNVAYSAGPNGRGHLFFVRDRVLLAQQFDASRVAFESDPIVVARPIIPGEAGRFAPFAVSGRTLVYRLLSSPRTPLVWMTRNGVKAGRVGITEANYRYPSLSPDATKLAVMMGDPETDKPDVWVLDLIRQVSERLTRDPVGAWFPHWMPDGQRIVFASARGGHWRIYRQSITDNRETALVDASDRFAQYPTTVTRDGRFLLTQAEKRAVWLLPLSEDARPERLVDGWQGRVSPDGRWLAYTANNTGVSEIYVTSFPKPTGRQRISTNGGEDPLWRQDGRELYYISGDNTLTAVPVSARATFEFGQAQPLFRVPPDSADAAGWGPIYAPAPDGQRFIVTEAIGAARSPVGVDEMLLSVTMNWKPGVR
jgi:Tol biopolymer transport system component